MKEKMEKDIHYNTNFIKTVHAVAVVVKVIQGEKEKILFLLENESKPWKRKGDYGPIFGTMEEGEDPSQTAIRESEEEAGLLLNREKLIKKGVFISYIKTRDGYIRTFNYIFHIILDQEPYIHEDETGEIGGNCFKTLSEMKNGRMKLRPGSEEVIIGYNEKNKIGVIYLEDGTYMNINK